MRSHGHRNLAFLLSDGPKEQALNWANLDPARRKELKQQYNDKGVSLVVAAFGQFDKPTTDDRDPTALANTMAQFVLTTDLDGIDVDWEEFTLVTQKQQANVGEAWLATFTRALRTQLPQGQFILTHARTSLRLRQCRDRVADEDARVAVGPWFQPGFCPGGCYLTVDKTVGSLIDWVCAPCLALYP